MFSKSGSLRGATRYITLGEAEYAGGDWRIDSPANIATNKSCANQVTLEINRFTGSFEYNYPED